MSEPSGESTHLTADDLRALYERIRDEPMRPHEHGPFHPDSLTRDGFYPCACGPVPIRGGRIDWDWGIAQMRAADFGSSSQKATSSKSS